MELQNFSVKILYITGYGRSGSTLLDRLLGSMSNAVSCGEVEKVWVYGLKDDNLCTCGERFSDCSFWSRVIRRAFGELDEAQLDQILQDKKALRMRRMGWTAVRRLLGCRDDAALKRYAETWAKLAQAIVEESGAGVMIDSSKSPQLPFFLRINPALDFRILHLVRDSRAVAFSYGRKKESMESHSNKRFIKQSGPLAAGLAWLSWNLQAWLVGRESKYMRVRYEELVSEPNKVLEDIRSFAGVSEGINGAYEPIPEIHMLAGNPMRFQSGDITVRADNEWKSTMPPWKKVLVTVVTLPLLVLFRYPLWVRSADR